MEGGGVEIGLGALLRMMEGRLGRRPVKALLYLLFLTILVVCVYVIVVMAVKPVVSTISDLIGGQGITINVATVLAYASTFLGIGIAVFLARSFMRQSLKIESERNEILTSLDRRLVGLEKGRTENQNKAQEPVEVEVGGETTDANAHLAHALHIIAMDDLRNTERCYWVRQDAIDWSHLRVTTGSAYIEFVFRLTSATVWTTTLTNKIDGLLKYRFDNAQQSGDIRQEPRVRLSDQLKNLERTLSGVFWVRQYLPTEVFADLNAHPTDEITFLFEDIRLSMQLRSPIDGHEEERLLELPNGWTTTVPPYL